MCVVGVAIVGGANGHDCLECRRTTRRNLKSIEPTPGDAHHPDNAAAPGLRGQPGYQLLAIVLLLFCVLVEEQAARIAATTNVDANASVAVACEIGMRQRVPLICPIALTVWKILQDRRNWVLFGVIGQPDAGSQRRAVFQRNQRVLDDTHGTWKSRNNHRRRSTPGTIIKPARQPTNTPNETRARRCGSL